MSYVPLDGIYELKRRGLDKLQHTYVHIVACVTSFSVTCLDSKSSKAIQIGAAREPELWENGIYDVAINVGQSNESYYIP